MPYPVNVKSAGDMFLLHQWLKSEPVDLLMGNTYLKYIARDEDIPLVRFGFPILDRVGHSYFPTVGYRGGLRLWRRSWMPCWTAKTGTPPRRALNWSCRTAAPGGSDAAEGGGATILLKGQTSWKSLSIISSCV